MRKWKESPDTVSLFGQLMWQIYATTKNGERLRVLHPIGFVVFILFALVYFLLGGSKMIFDMSRDVCVFWNRKKDE